MPGVGSDLDTPIIEIDRLSKLYRAISGGSILALYEISMKVYPRQFVSIVGPSGCGKSTLLKLIGGLIRPTQGTILLNGKRVTGPQQHGHVGNIFQRPALLPWRNVFENVLFPIKILKRNRNDYLAEAEKLLGLVGLKDFRTRFPSELSGGMQQRISLCRALIHDPFLLLMDEPFGALDAITREEMNLELLHLWSVKKKTVLFVTHSIGEAVFLSDTVLIMSPRPGMIQAEISIDLPRPRTLETQSDRRFIDYLDRIRRRIHSSRDPRGLSSVANAEGHESG